MTRKEKHVETRGGSLRFVESLVSIVCHISELIPDVDQDFAQEHAQHAGYAYASASNL